MIRFRPASRRHRKADRGRATTKVAVAVKEAKRRTRVFRVIHPGIRVPVRIVNSGKDSRLWQEYKVVARRATATTTVIRLWRGPDIRRATREWRIGWDIASWTRMISG